MSEQVSRRGAGERSAPPPERFRSDPCEPEAVVRACHQYDPNRFNPFDGNGREVLVEGAALDRSWQDRKPPDTDDVLALVYERLHKQERRNGHHGPHAARIEIHSHWERK